MTITNAKPMCFYHPLKVIFLDNSLEQKALNAFDTQINITRLTNPDLALEVIDSQDFYHTPTIFRSEPNLNTDTIAPYAVNFKAGNMLDLIYDKKRFNTLSILILNSEMPELDEIEFCEKLKGKTIFKIMLATPEHKDTAIRAFNSGLIDKFLLQTSDDLCSEIIQAVQELTQKYFRELSWNIINAHTPFIKALFNNKLYQQLFADVAKEAKAIEYYLVDHSGSILFLDRDANPTWLIVKNTQELADQFDLISGYDLPSEELISVAKKEKILFLLSEKEYKNPIDKWCDYLFESKKLDDNYYYSIIQQPVTDFIDWDRVVSFSSYTKGNSGNTNPLFINRELSV